MHDRLGMFIHFGLYALAGRHEWVQNREHIPPEDYRTYFEHFDPDLFDAADWARQCKQAGMRYAVLTTKHHEGFCLWDSEYTDYKITNTPLRPGPGTRVRRCLPGVDRHLSRRHGPQLQWRRAHLCHQADLPLLG